MSIQLTIEQLDQALAARDNNLIQLIQTLSFQDDPEPDMPVRDGALTFDHYLAAIKNTASSQKSLEERRQLRIEIMTALEANDAEVPLPDRLRLHKTLMSLWQSNDSYSRRCLLEVIPIINLTYGPWRALKLIFKQAEARRDTEIYGALAARFDQAMAAKDHTVSQTTLAYLCRRAWRYLRELGQTLPALYADAASDVLAHYDDNTQWRNTWVANQIFFRESGQYNRRGFHYSARLNNQKEAPLKNRAFAEAWARTPRPLFSLLERAQSEKVRQFATAALKTDFRASLRDVETDWVVRLVGRHSATLDDFVVWILDSTPRFEQAAFKQLGLHDAMLALFHSSSAQASTYAVNYAQVHARDLPLDTLIALVDNQHEKVRKFAGSLIQSRHPREEVGLEGWGRLLDTRYGAALATENLRKHFGKKELTTQWFKARLLSPQRGQFKFATENLLQLHPPTTLGTAYFAELLRAIDYTANPRDNADVIQFICVTLAQLDLNTLDPEYLKHMLCNPRLRQVVIDWIDRGKLDVRIFPTDFLKTLAYHPDWEQDGWINELKQTQPWAHELEFSDDLSATALGWLADVRAFSPEQLGFEWLMQLVQRGEPQYHQFAVKTLNKSFFPADFAPNSDNDVTAGCEYLWELMTAKGKEDAPLAKFARSYIRAHHPGIYKAKTGKNVDPGAEIPESFLSFERVEALFHDKRKSLRDLALELAEWEFARWQPAPGSLIRLSESLYDEVRQFIVKAMTVADTPEHRRYRLPPEQLSIECVYDFCESEKESARALGRYLIGRHAHLQEPQALFRLTESPDRKVRAFVIRTFWSWYRQRATTSNWVPNATPSAQNKEQKLQSATGNTAAESAQAAGTGAPKRPETLPATLADLETFLRRILFEVPPGRSQKVRAEGDGVRPRLRPLPARKAKLQLVETLQSLALEDVNFAHAVLPLLREFMASRGKSERAACLMAVTRIEHCHFS